NARSGRIRVGTQAVPSARVTYTRLREVENSTQGADCHTVVHDADQAHSVSAPANKDILVADLDNGTKRKLELLFGMGDGYVLDFSNARFAEFVKTAIGIDPYEKYPPASKAKLLRRIWHQEPMPIVAELNLELLEHWRVGKLITDDGLSESESTLHDELKAQFGEVTRSPTQTDLQFLARDFGELDLAALPRELSSQDVVRARLDEIDRCLEAGAPLAVVFLAGSTLEGLLMQVAMSQAQTYADCPSAPKAKGRTKEISEWSLDELITVSRILNVLGEDVSRHAGQVRHFRNYIHPRQQMNEAFEPRMETARIAQQVLRAALADLKGLGRVEQVRAQGA
ncbi:MAG: hypothetical protein WD942_06915, partial [Dehalococcoidia bacterium]